MQRYDKDTKEHNDNEVTYWKLSKIYEVEASIIRRWGHIYDALK